MKTIAISMTIVLFVSCSEKKPTDKQDQMYANKDTPKPKSKITTTNPKEGLAPLTYYFGFKARE